MKKTSSRVHIYRKLNDYQLVMFMKGSPIIWEAVDDNYTTLFKETDLNKVINFSNRNLTVSHITKYIGEL